MTKIILQRHGESMANALHLYAGTSNFPLSERGIMQAEAAAKALVGEKIDAVYSSDLARAYETAVPHATLRGLRVRARKELREINIGEWEGKSRDFLLENYPYEAGFIWTNYFGLFKAPGGESAPDAGRRFECAILEIAKENEGKTVLVAAHAAVIRLFWGRLLGVEAHDLCGKVPFPTNASFSIVAYDGEKLTPVEYSIDAHTKALGTVELK